MPKKKKKGADKEKKVRKKACLNERETVSYEQQILDNNKQLARLRSVNEHLEVEVDALKAKLTELENDRSDVVAHLKRVLQEKSEEARELNDRLLAMEELRRDEQISHKKKEDAMQLEYQTMETNLSAEVKLAAGKLNALEDWRLARIDLMRKFEIQEEQMAEQEERHNKTLYQAEKSLVIGKAKMQKEMEERLNELARSFREATNIRIADATHRAVRENVVLNLELDAMYRMFRELDLRLTEHKEKERNLRIHAALLQTEAQIALNKLLEHNRLSDRLAQDHREMSLMHGKICREEAHRATKEQIVQTCRDASTEAQRKARILQQNIQTIDNETESVLEEWRNNCRKAQSLANVLDMAKRYVVDVAQCSNEVPVEGVCTPCHSWFEKKLQVLMDILEKRQSFIPSGVDDFTEIEAECSSEKLSPVLSADDSPAGAAPAHSGDEVSLSPTIQDVVTDRDVPKCLSLDSSSDITSPRETETPRPSMPGTDNSDGSEIKRS